MGFKNVNKNDAPFNYAGVFFFPFKLILFYLFYFKHKYIVIMQFYSLFVTKDFLEGVQGAGRGSSET